MSEADGLKTSPPLPHHEHYFQLFQFYFRDQKITIKKLFKRSGSKNFILTAEKHETPDPCESNVPTLALQSALEDGGR